MGADLSKYKIYAVSIQGIMFSQCHPLVDLSGFPHVVCGKWCQKEEECGRKEAIQKGGKNREGISFGT